MKKNRWLRYMARKRSVMVICIFISLPIILCSLLYLYYHYTNPSWEELESLIDNESVVILKSSHKNHDEYYADFDIYIPRDNDQLRFLSSIEDIGGRSLIEKKCYPNGDVEYYFPLNEYWVHVIGKHKRWRVEINRIFLKKH